MEEVKKELISRDDIERFKPYFDLVKYGTSIIAALMATSGFIIRISNDALVPRWVLLTLFLFGIVANIWTYFRGNAVYNEFLALFETKHNPETMTNEVKRIKKEAYTKYSWWFFRMCAFWALLIFLSIL